VNVITLARKSIDPWWWSKKIEICRSVFKCFNCFIWNLCKCNCWLIVEEVFRSSLSFSKTEYHYRPRMFPSKSFPNNYLLSSYHPTLSTVNYQQCHKHINNKYTFTSWNNVVRILRISYSFHPIPRDYLCFICISKTSLSCPSDKNIVKIQRVCSIGGMVLTGKPASTPI